MIMLSRLPAIALLLTAGVACTNTPPVQTISATRDARPSALPHPLAEEQEGQTDTCPRTRSIRAKPPNDAAVQGSPELGQYFVNEDRSIWAGAWWTDQEATYLRAGEKGNKVGWFRPAGATLEITGRRLDGEAPPLEAEVPCCYPTRFQATGLIFPSQGCWEVTAKAAGSELSFVVWVEP